MNKKFYHSTITSQQIESFLSEKAGRDLSKVFDQYLRTTLVPVLELKAEADKIKFKWTNCVQGFNMPVKLTNGQWIYPTTSEQKIKSDSKNFRDVAVDPGFYVGLKKT
jgi:aminopeptidase N